MMKLTVLTYNIRGDFWSREATLGLARIVKEREIDVICLQEVCKRFNSHKENSHDILSELKVALGGEFGDFAFLPVQCPTMSAGTAIVYRKSLLVPVGDPYMKHFPLMSARKPYEEWINGYMAPMRRMIMTEGFRMGSRMLIVYCAHLDYFGGDNRRIYQINHMFNLWGDRRNGDEICEVLAGDFNTWMPYKLIGLYRRFGKLRKWLQKKGIREASSKVWWTHNFDQVEADAFEKEGKLQLGLLGKIIRQFNHSFRQKEDYIWYGGKGMHMVECERIDVNWSDHYPVIAKFSIEETDASSGTPLGGSGRA